MEPRNPITVVDSNNEGLNALKAFDTAVNVIRCRGARLIANTNFTCNPGEAKCAGQDHVCIEIFNENDDPTQGQQLIIYQAWEKHIGQIKNNPSMAMMSRTSSELGGHVVGAIMSNALTSNTNSSPWTVCLMQLASVLGLCFTLAGLSLQEKRRLLSFRMTKIGAIATASAIIISMATHLPPPIAWTVAPLAIVIAAIAVILAA